MRRYGVQRCDEGGTLTDSEGRDVPHTWDVIDRLTLDRYGEPRVVLNTDRRSEAREEAAKLNGELPRAERPWSSNPALRDPNLDRKRSKVEG